jgi:hypothetical protein
LQRKRFHDSEEISAIGTAVAIACCREPVVMVRRPVENQEDAMAAKKIQAKSKKTSAKKGARKVSSTTPRGMARRQVYQPPSND